MIKTIISAEDKLIASYLNLIPDKRCCFELLGFDILIDSNLNPWLIEVNLSPSLNCDSPLDHKIKTELISECFNMSRILPINIRDNEYEYITEHINLINISSLEMKINKELSHIGLLKNFKITKSVKQAIWDTDEENSRTTN